MTLQNVIVGLGEILWDLYPDTKYLGGAPANVVIHACRLGATGVVVSAVGEDRLGDEIIASLEKQGLDSPYIQRSLDRPTGTVGVRLDEKGNPRFECSEDVAFDYLEWSGELEELMGEADGIVVGSLAQRNDVSRETIQRCLKKADGAVRVFDVNFRRWDETTGQVVMRTLAVTDILKLNEDELKRMRAAFGQQNVGVTPFLDWLVKEYDLKLAALSLGEGGCLLTGGKDRVFSPGVRISPVDTTGCGDAFVAGLLVKYLEDVSLEKMAEFANVLGAFVAIQKGAVPEYTMEDVERFSEVHPERNEVKV